MGKYTITGVLAVATVVAFCLKLLLDPFPTIIVMALAVITVIAWIFEGLLDRGGRDRKMQQRETVDRAYGGLLPKRSWDQSRRGAIVDKLGLLNNEPGVPSMSEHHLVHDLSGVPTQLLGQPFSEPPEDPRDDPANWGRDDA